LNEPHLHSGSIHWVDRDKGVFKIVDSVRVAHLWGKRKNRPAMNYDKLSRCLSYQKLQFYKNVQIWENCFFVAFGPGIDFSNKRQPTHTMAGFYLATHSS
jgi:hypothetical protein